MDCPSTIRPERCVELHWVCFHNLRTLCDNGRKTALTVAHQGDDRPPLVQSSFMADFAQDQTGSCRADRDVYGSLSLTQYTHT